MSISLLASKSSTQGVGYTWSDSLTVPSNSNRLIVFTLLTSGTSQTTGIDSVTFNGSAMSSLYVSSPWGGDNDWKLWVYYYIAPSIGVGTVTANFTYASDYGSCMSAGAIYCFGSVNQSSPFRAQATGSAASLSSISAAVTDIVTDICASDNDNTPNTPGSGQTSVYAANLQSGYGNAAMSYKTAGSTSESVSWGNFAGNIRHWAVAIKSDVYSSISPSASPSASASISPSASVSPSVSISPSISKSISPSASISPSLSSSISPSVSPSPAPINADYLIVAGGGGASTGTSNVGSGGGGAGGYLAGSLSIMPTQSYSVIVGAGGTTAYSSHPQGYNSVFDALTAIGGGFGGGASDGNNGTATDGGSGGGSAGANRAIGAGSQGHNGGYGFGTYGSSVCAGGGGGGSSAVGTSATGSTSPGSGGAGTANSISGTSVTYAVGGNGASWNGGAGGAGTVNTGNGGSGGGTGQTGGAGGSGVVIIRYLTADVNADGTGGTITHSGGYTIHKFTASETFIAPTGFYPSISPSISPSASVSPSGSKSPSISPSLSRSISPSTSPSTGVSVSPSISKSISPSISPSESAGGFFLFM